MRSSRLAVVLACVAALGACAKSPKPVATTTPTPTSTASSESPTPSESATPSSAATAKQSISQPPPEAIESCGAPDLKVNVFTDKATYAQLEKVKISLVARNRSTHACTTEGNACMDAVSVSDSSGKPVWRSTKPGTACPAPQKHVVAPGAAQTYSFTWDQRACPGGDVCAQYFVPAGDYTANGTWRLSTGDGIGATPAKFKIS